MTKPLVGIIFMVLALYGCSTDSEETQAVEKENSIEVLQDKLYKNGKLLIPDLRQSDKLHFNSDDEYYEFLKAVEREDVAAFMDFYSDKVMKGELKVDEQEEEMVRMMFEDGKKKDWIELSRELSRVQDSAAEKLIQEGQ